MYQEKEKSKKMSIAVAGALPRIGATTQALQICYYYMEEGHKVCLIQMNGSKYMEQLSLLIQGKNTLDKELERFHFDGFDIYFTPIHLNELYKMDYEYYVFDCGCFLDPQFNKSFFKNTETKVLMLGAKANEVCYSIQALQETFEWLNCFYVFSFVQNKTRNAVAHIVEQKWNMTRFAPVICNPLAYHKESKVLFDTMFSYHPSDEKVSYFTPRQKRRFVYPIVSLVTVVLVVVGAIVISKTVGKTKAYTPEEQGNLKTQIPLTSAVTASPTETPTDSPTILQTSSPVYLPTNEPTLSPTILPTIEPTIEPTKEPEEKIEVTKIWLPLLMDISLGSKEQIPYEIEPEGAVNKKLTWKSSNPDVASVTKNGVVIAKKEGEAIITATTSNKVTESVEVIVSNE